MDYIAFPESYEFKSHNLTKKERENNITACFKNDLLYDIYPKDETLSLNENFRFVSKARFVEVDGKKFDLCNPKEII